MTFKNLLQKAINTKTTHLCLGLDPPFDLFQRNSSKEALPAFFNDSLSKKRPIHWLQTYCETILEAAHALVPAIKPQSAYFEAFGPEGFKVLQDLVAKAKTKGLVTILDAKRGDIASTMKAYGAMAYESMGADALTVTAYMGMDVLDPLKEWLSKSSGTYVVWISSNPTGDDLQKQVAGPLLDQLEKFMDQNNLHGSLGLVYGATKFEQITQWDPAVLKKFNLLMPGVGAQGAQVTPALTNFLSEHSSALIPQSRSLGSLKLLPGEAEPTCWEDFGNLVKNRVHKAALSSKTFSKSPL